jgi:hypothetical protein
MRNKTLQRVIKVLGFISIVAAMPAAQALQLTLSVPDCPSGQALSFNPTTSTLACSGGTVPDPNTVPTGCTITGNNTTSANPNPPSTLVTLTASCSGGATPVNFQWTIAGIPVGTNSQLSTSPTANTTYVVTPSNSIGTGSAVSTTVYVGSQPVQTSAPGNCFVTQSPNTATATVTAGTNVALSVTCSTGNAPTSCSWSGGIASTSCFVNVTPQSTTTYSVTASNSGGAAAAVSSTVNIGGTTSGGGNPGVDMCNSGDLRYTINWPSSGQVRLTTSGFGNQRAAFKITVPTTFSPALNTSHLGVISMSEIPGTPTTPREITVSKNSCDFSSGTYIYNGMGFAPVSPSVAFTVNNPTGYFSVGASFNLNAGEVYYVNVRNSSFGVPACGYSACDLLLDFATPNRY